LYRKKYLQIKRNTRSSCKQSYQIRITTISHCIKITTKKLEHYANVKDQETKLIEVIDEIAKIQKNLIQYVFPSDKTTTGNLYERYRKMRDMFQSAHPICIAIMGGLHRTALATHLLGNWEIHNEPPKIINDVPLTPIQINSPLLYDIAVHVITPAKMKNPPKLQDFSNEYCVK